MVTKKLAALPPGLNILDYQVLLCSQQRNFYNIMCEQVYIIPVMCHVALFILYIIISFVWYIYLLYIPYFATAYNQCYVNPASHSIFWFKLLAAFFCP